MKLFITDTNVFFDLMNIEALPEFFGLDFEICTTDFVVNEILQLEQAEQIQNFIRSKQLAVFSFSSKFVNIFSQAFLFDGYSFFLFLFCCVL